MAEGWNSLSASWFRAKFTDLDAYVYENPNRVAISTDLPECRQRQKKIQVSAIRVESSLRS